MGSKAISLAALLNEDQVVADPNNSAHTRREGRDESGTEDEYRTAFERDYARVLHSSSFRRLQGKMQLLRHQDSDFYRTRLTHSLEVAQIGEGIARRCTPAVDTSIVRLACLAHDIGNPPFGHYGEDVLNEMMQEHGGFEGNAQTLRILTRLERKRADEWGLNLTLAARMAVVKYNVTYKQALKEAEKKKKLPAKFIYDEDAELVKPAGKLAPLSIECQIMDLADDTAYATHDLEDGFHAGLLDPRDVMQAMSDADPKKFSDSDRSKSKAQFEQALKNAEKRCGSYSGPVFEKALTSELINQIISGIGTERLQKDDKKKRGHTHDLVLNMGEREILVALLKDTAYRLIVGNPEVSAYEVAGGLVIRQLFGALCDERYNKDLRLLPEQYRLRRVKTGDEVPRLVCDYLAGMTETFLLRLFKTHFGKENATYDALRPLDPQEQTTKPKKSRKKV